MVMLKTPDGGQRHYSQGKMGFPKISWPEVCADRDNSRQLLQKPDPPESRAKDTFIDK